MISDKLINFSKYVDQHTLFIIVDKYLKSTVLKDLKPGRYEIGSGISIGINEYDTLSESETFLESHKKYIDIQIMIKGQEGIGICHLEDCKIKEFHEDKDYQVLDGEYKIKNLTESCFMIFFPEDVHKPMLKVNNQSEHVLKAVVKVPVR